MLWDNPLSNVFLRLCLCNYVSVAACLRDFALKRNLSPKQNICLYWKSIKLVCVSRTSYRGYKSYNIFSPITPSMSPPAYLYSRLVHGSTRSHHAREPVGPGALLSASSPEAARPSPQEAPPPPSAPRAQPGHTMALRVRVGV